MKKNKESEYESMTIEVIEKRLTGQEKKFVENFETTHSTVLAAQVAGYTADAEKAAAIGSRLLRNPRIAAYRRLRILDLYKKRCLSAEEIIMRIDDFYRRSMQDVPHMTRSRETKEMEPDGTWMYDSKDALNALKLLGNIYGVFDKKTDRAGTAETIEDYLKRMGDPEPEE